jgi:hypothetical protein
MIHKIENKSNLGIFTMYIALAIIMRKMLENKIWGQHLTKTLYITQTLDDHV